MPQQQQAPFPDFPGARKQLNRTPTQQDVLLQSIANLMKSGMEEKATNGKFLQKTENKVTTGKSTEDHEPEIVFATYDMAKETGQILPTPAEYEEPVALADIEASSSSVPAKTIVLASYEVVSATETQTLGVYTEVENKRPKKPEPWKPRPNQ